MDVFNALWDNPEQRTRPPDDNFQLFTMEEWFAMSSTHKILTGSLQCPLPHEIEPRAKGMSKTFQNRNVRDLLMQKSKSNGASKNTTEAMGSEEGKLYVPGLTKFPQLSRISTLSSQEHADCLKLLIKFEGKPLEELTPTEKAEYQLFQSLYARVKEEQKIFLGCAKENWPEFRDRTIKLKGDANSYFLQYWTNKVTNAMSQYPHKYKSLRTFSLHTKNELNQRLHFIKNLLNVGKIPSARLPEFHKPFRVATSILKLRTYAHLNIPPSYLNGTLHKVPVSRDPNAERLARLHSANVVISTSGMRCLLDNHDENKFPPPSGTGKSWVLPIIVKEHRSFCNGKPVTKTIIFIDKQLPKPKMTGFEKVSWYQKHALFAAVVDRNHPAGIQFDIKGTDLFIRKDQDSTIITEGNSTGINAEESAHKFNLLDKEICNTTKQSTANDVLSNFSYAPPLANNNNDCDDDDSDDSNIGDDGDDEDDALTIDLSDNGVLSTEQPTPERIDIKSDDSERTVQVTKSEEKIGIEDSEIKEQVAKSKETIGIIDSVGKDLATKSEEIIGPLDSKIKDQAAKSEETIGIMGSNARSRASKLACSGDSDGPVQPVSILATNKWEKLSAPECVKIVNGNALPISSTNLTYNLWCLRSEHDENDQNKSNCAGDINLLIRSRVDCCECFDKRKTESISLATKPDYQLEYGPGIIPLSDLTRQWGKLLIQPDTALARIRVNVHNTEMVKIEKRSILEIEEETQALYKTALSDTLQHLKGILAELTQLPLGRYLLSHSPQMGSMAELFKESNNSDLVDWHLPKDYGNLPEIINLNVPWPIIDTSVILPKHLQKQCMPCTFHCPKGPTLRSKPSKPQKQEPQIVTGTKKKKKKNKNKQNKDTEKPSDEADKARAESPN